jgi:hypothetical protein
VVFTSGLDKHARPGKLPRVVFEELLSQLVFLIFKLDRLEQAARLLGLPALLLNLEHDLIFVVVIGLHSLSDQLVLLRDGTD